MDVLDNVEVVLAGLEILPYCDGIDVVGLTSEGNREFVEGLGVTDWYLAPAQVFVLPGTSGANRRKDYDGRPDRLSWWKDLAALAGGPAVRSEP